MRQQALSVLWLFAACHFDSSGIPAQPASDAAADATGSDMTDGASGDIDAAPASESICDSSNSDLVACYSFDDDTTDDQSSSANHLTASNVAFEPGKRGKAVRLNATSSLRAANSASLDVAAFTIEAWVKPAALPGVGRVGLVDEDGQYGFFLYAGGEVYCTAAGTGAVTAITALPLDEWTHLACTHGGNGNEITIWLQGNKGPSTIATGNIATGNSNGLAVGGNSPSGDPFIGALDEVRIYRTVRTAEQICAAAQCRLSAAMQ